MQYFTVSIILRLQNLGSMNKIPSLPLVVAWHNQMPQECMGGLLAVISLAWSGFFFLYIILFSNVCSPD